MDHSSGIHSMCALSFVSLLAHVLGDDFVADQDLIC